MTAPAGANFVTELFHGYNELENLAAVGGVPNVDLYRIAQKPFSSYEVVVDATSGDIGPILDVQRVGPDGTHGHPDLAAHRRRVQPQPALGQHQGDRGDERVRSASSSGGCDTDCGPDDVYQIHAFETTYSIPRFNNAGTQITVLLLQNPNNYHDQRHRLLLGYGRGPDRKHRR